MSEVKIPQHLLDRSAARRAKLAGDDQRTREIQERQEADARAARLQMRRAKSRLPEICRTCVFRPENTGGSGACKAVNQTLTNLKSVSEALRGTKAREDRLTPEQTVLVSSGSGVHLWELVSDGMPRRGSIPDSAKEVLEAIDNVQDAAAKEYTWLKGLLSVVYIGADEDLPKPQGLEVEVCTRTLADAIDPTVVHDAGSVIRAAVAVNEARGAGVFGPQPSF